MYTEIIDTTYGKMIVPSTDKNQVQYYKQNQKHINESEIITLAETLKGDERPVIIDCGTNVGFFTFGLNYLVPNSTIYTFEAQRIIFNMVCGSIALNEYENIYAFNCAVSNTNEGTIRVPKYDYNKVSNFGSVEVERHRGKENIGQPDPQQFDYVPNKSIDSLNLDYVSLIKIDVEGMEEKVLSGAEKTIEKNKPILFIEYSKSNKTNIMAFLNKYSYNVEDIDGNYLCRPK